MPKHKGDDYLVTAMNYEVGNYPSPVRIIREGEDDSGRLPNLPRAGEAAVGEDGG